MTTATTVRGMHTYTRSGNGRVEKPYEKPVIMPETDNTDPALHAWADARFALDIMSEHGLFFALLMPEELAAKERAQALEFSRKFAEMYEQVDADSPPA